MKTFACKDAGVQCDWSTQGQSDDEIMGNISTHAREKHGMKDIPQDLLAKVKNAIRSQKDDSSEKQQKTA